MAIVTSVGNGDWIADAATVWDSGTIPLPEDDVRLNGHTIVQDGEVSVTSITGSNPSTLAFGNFDFTCSGTLSLFRITATTGADMSSCTIAAPNFHVGVNGSLTLSDDLAITADFELDGGTINTNNHTLTVMGNLTKTSGTVTKMDVDHVGPGSMRFSGVRHYRAVSGVITVEAGITAAAGSLTVDSAATVNLIANNYTLPVYGNDLIDIQGTVAATTGKLILMISNADRTNAGRIAVPNLQVSGADLSFTQNGAIEVTNLVIASAGNDTLAEYIIGCAGQMLGAVTLGVITGTGRAGKLTTGDYPLTMTSLASAKAGLANEAALGASSINLSGTIDGSAIAVTSVGANLHGGTIQDVTSTGVIHCWGVTDGTGNNQYVAHESGQRGFIGALAL